MSYSLKGNNIYLTRGDSLCINLSIKNTLGVAYTPATGDSIRFAMKSSYTDKKVLINKTINLTTMQLVLAPSDTKSLAFDSYVYDIQLTKATGEVDTFIKGKLILTEEVD